MTTGSTIDVDGASFDEDVLERSHEVPVVVDFWASWCGPCRTLGPILERAVAARNGEVLLAKVDVDRNQDLAARYRVQGIPAVKGFRDGKVVAEFVGAQPERQVQAFLDRLVPSEADRVVSLARRLEGAGDDDGACDAYERALSLESNHRDAALGLARLLVATDPDRALALVASHRPAPEAEKIATRAELARSGGDLDGLRRAVDASPDDGQARIALARALAAGDLYEEAVEHLLAAVETGGETREAAREQLVSLFPLIGEDSPVVTDARRRLASALF